MLPPHEDLSDRFPVWDSMQMVWMDVDTQGEIQFIARACAQSKYSVNELEQIYWNEVLPAVSFNLRLSSFIPEWAGFNEVYLKEQVLHRHRFGRRSPVKILHPYALRWWRQIQRRVHALRSEGSA